MPNIVPCSNCQNRTLIFEKKVQLNKMLNKLDTTEAYRNMLRNNIKDSKDLEKLKDIEMTVLMEISLSKQLGEK